MLIRIFLVLSISLSSLTSLGATPRTVTPRGPLLPNEKAMVDLFDKATNSVVYITTLVYQRDAFSFNVFEIPQGTGSGFVWDKQGHVVTNFHVIRGAQNVRVRLADQSKWEADVVGIAPDKDLAVLKIKAPKSKLKPIPVGRSQNLRVGQNVYAIGNPFGLDQTLTTGIISALGREIQALTGRPIQGVIQTDAAINPGNSGGPLLDSAGRCIGVNTAIYSPSGAYAGVGFAVPIDTVNRIAPQLIAFGKVIRPGFGVHIAEDRVAKRLGIRGVLVIEVPPRSAAAKAGIQPTMRDRFGDIVLGDVIVAVNDKPTPTGNDLFKILDQFKVGDKVKVKLARGRTQKEVFVELQAL